ncbi:hypothetical protein CWI37_2644p0010 [Hamiltosporidium tvaerminnensis]|uniref:Uncharacterized protein n=1 Tax=Hamiltosporidium tvaerminnensis TaxID=1176355 RepID=A0A4Q9KQG5_9MICR|nr:hypothetical protein CWI37_2644p0010 [Hamiltosporidium tvaerminnensis]
MFETLDSCNEIFEEKLNDLEISIKYPENERTTMLRSECKDLVDICLSLIKYKKYYKEDLKKFIFLRNKYFKLNIVTDNESEKIPFIQESERELDCRIKSNELRLYSLVRNHNIKNISNKINEIVNINDYIKCVVDMQDQNIDRLSHIMGETKFKSRNTVKELEVTYIRKKNKKRIIFYILGNNILKDFCKFLEDNILKDYCYFRVLLVFMFRDNILKDYCYFRVLLVFMFRDNILKDFCYFF